MMTPVPSFPSAIENVSSLMLDTKKQRDNVHDFIFLNSIERKLVDTPEFQRLRYIKQLGFANFVYHGAEHSRYAHSLGVCHTAKLMVDHVNRNHRVEAEEATSLEQIDLPEKHPIQTVLELTDRAIPFNSSEISAFPEIAWIQRFCIGLAALLHDIPHPPMSHALENEGGAIEKHDKVSENPQLFQYLLGTGGVANTLREFSPDLRNYFRANASFLSSYVTFSEKEIDEFVVRRNGLSKNDLLGALIFEILAYQSLEKHPFKSFEYIIPTSKKKRMFYFSEFFRPFYGDLISNTICADLIDYLMRDALNTGVRKQIDLKFLDCAFLRTVADEGLDLGGRNSKRRRVVFDLRNRRGGIRKEVVSDLLSLLESRYVLMERVYMHRTKLAASAMLSRAFLLSGMKGKVLHSGDATSDDALLRRLLASREARASSLAEKLIARKLYSPLFIIDSESCRQSPPAQLNKAGIVKKCRLNPLEKNCWTRLRECELQLAGALFGVAPRELQKSRFRSEYPFIVFCMGEDVAYKEPAVLVEVPTRSKLARVESVKGARSIMHLLKDFFTDAGAQTQISSMLSNYNNLWKLYVFADKEAVRQHASMVPAVYVELIRFLGARYPVEGEWKKVRNAGGLLTQQDLNRAMDATPLRPKDLISCFCQFFHCDEPAAVTELSKYGIFTQSYGFVWNLLLPKLADPMVLRLVEKEGVRFDEEARKRWLIEQLKDISSRIPRRKRK